MPPPAQSTFGKRNVMRNAPPRELPAPDHAAFFAAARATVAEAPSAQARVVPRSFKAAFLAGLVVGCALAGFDVTGQEGARRFAGVTDALGIHPDMTRLVPALILLGLLGGARVAAATIILVHAALARAAWTSHAAYALGGAAASVGLAAALLVLLGDPPAHGWVIESLAGAGAGFFYRVFAGARRAESG